MIKLLLVEDEAISRRGLTQFLLSEGYSVVSAASGEEALKILETQSFDAVITDYRHGRKVNGIDILTQFERLNPGRGRLLLTAYPASQIGELPVGTIHLSKPIDLDEFLQKLKSVVP